MDEVSAIIKKKKWYKHKWIYIILIMILLAGGVAYGQYKKSTAQPQYETVKVEQGVLKQTVDATGNVESANELDLRFETSGRVQKIFKQVNDQVRIGGLIMELDLNQLNAAVAQAQAGVEQAQANLDKQLAGNTLEYVAQLEAALKKAQADLNQGEGSPLGVENNKAVENAYDNMVVLLQSVRNTLQSSLTEADNILGVDNVFANDSFERVLSALDSSALDDAKIKYDQSKSQNTYFYDQDVHISSNHDKIDEAASRAVLALDAAKNMLLTVSLVLDKTVPVGNLIQSQLDILKTDIQTIRAEVATRYASVIEEMHAIDTARTNYYSYLALVEKAQAALNDAKNPPREVDVASYRAALLSAKASLAQAVANRSKAVMVAPVVGTIGRIMPKVGEFVSSQDNVVKIVSPHFEVKVDIPETDIVKVKNGDLAEIKLDAYGDEAKFKGVVTQIEKGQTVIQDVVYYNVTVSLEGDSQRQILNGMTANVVFATEQKDNVLYIPQRAVRTNSGKYVKVLKNGQLKDVEVKLGLKGDGGMVEIIEGLQEGQEVVIGTVGK